MTREEFAQIIAVLKGIYADPKFIADTISMEVWYKIFKDYDYESISTAAGNYIVNDTFGKAPVPGQIIACIETDVSKLSEQEAWSLVTKAISNSNYHSVEEFAKLPKEIQIAVGSAANLKELGQMDMSTVQSVEKSHFERNYRTAVERIRHEKQTPDGVRQMIEEHKAAMIEDGQDGKN